MNRGGSPITTTTTTNENDPYLYNMYQPTTQPQHRDHHNVNVHSPVKKKRTRGTPGATAAVTYTTATATATAGTTAGTATRLHRGLPSFLHTFGTNTGTGTGTGRSSLLPHNVKECGDHNMFRPTLFTLSQDSNSGFPPGHGGAPNNSCSYSQLSQDFADRLGDLNMHSQLSAASSSSEHSHFSVPMASEAIEFEGHRHIPLEDGDSSSFMLSSIIPTDHFAAPKPVAAPISNVAAESTQRKEIFLASPLKNPFLEGTTPAVISASDAMKPPKSMWISAFRDRSRLLQDFEVSGTLGEGTFSVVFCALNRLDGSVYAIKKIKKPISNDKEGALVTREVHSLAALNNGPNIVRYFGSWINDGFLFIQTELCSLGSCEVFVASAEEECDVHGQLVHSFTLPLIWTILSKISQALDYMHKRGMVHLDIRPANIFIAKDMLSSPYPASTGSIMDRREEIARGVQSGIYIIKLGDFGHCCRSDIDYSSVIEGETRYCPRELLAGSGPFDLTKADVFSLGMSLYELCLGRSLGASTDDAASQNWHDIRAGILSPAFLTQFSSDIQEVIVQMLHIDPVSRPTACELLYASSNWLAQNH